MSVTDKEIIIGCRRSERLLKIEERNINDDDDEENNGPLDGRVDPSQILPLEVFAYLVEKCFGKLPVKELQKMRFISKEWRIGLERMWRKGVVVCLNDSLSNKTSVNLPLNQISDFLMQIKNPSFDYKNTPLRNFKIKNADFSSCAVGSFLEYCGPYIKHLNVENSQIVGPASNFYQYLFVTLKNMEQLQLASLYFYDTTSFTDDFDGSSEPVNLPVAQNLASLVLDLRSFSVESNFDLCFIMRQKCFWSSFPNLKKLALFVQANSPIFKTEIFLQSIMDLSLTRNHFQYLKHLQICNNSFCSGNDREVNVLLKVEKICNSEFPCLESFHLHYFVKSGRDEEQLPLVAERIVAAFGRQLKNLTLLLEPLPMSEFFPFRTRLEKLERLTVSCDLSDFILNAKYLPNLKSFSARTRYCTRATCKSEMFHRIYWLNSENRIYGEVINDNDSNGNIRNVERIWTQYHQETMDDPLDKDFIFFEDDNRIFQKFETPSNEDKIILKRGEPDVHNYDSVSEDEENELGNEQEATAGFLSVGYRRLRRTILFENVSELALEMSLSCRIFKKLPKWMPSVISLEAQITACTLPVICDKWRKMQKLTLLTHRSVYRRPLENLENNTDWTFCENYAPIDDCAIIGVKHFTNPHFKCSLQHLVEGKMKCVEINWEYFTTPLRPQIIPNLTFLKDLTHFKMEIGRTSSVKGQMMTLSDESVFRAFFKLSKLEYLEILADLNTVTIEQLFKKIPKCVVYRLHDHDEASNSMNSNQQGTHPSIDHSYVAYYGRRNF